MSPSTEQIKKHVRVDITVLALFAILTLIHVTVVQMHLPGASLIVLGLYAARIALVFYYFAYLTKGHSIITLTLLLTAFFLGVLLILPLFR